MTTNSSQQMTEKKEEGKPYWTQYPGITREDLQLMQKGRLNLIPYHTTLHPPGTCQQALDATMRDLRVRPTDVFVVTYPKAATHWMQDIVAKLCRTQHKPEAFVPWLDRIQIHCPQRLPELLEDARSHDPTTAPCNDTIRPEQRRYWKSHLPANLTPGGGGKYIYLMRNGKDVACSMYAHVTAPFSKIGYKGLDFNHYLELHKRGLVPFGDWYAHVLGWWRASRGEVDIGSDRTDEAELNSGGGAQRTADGKRPDVLFVHFEELRADPRAGVLRVARFLGFPEEELTDAFIDSVVADTSLKVAKARQYTVVKFREGGVGGWVNSMTVEQSEGFDRLFKAQAAATDSQELLDSIRFR